MSHFNEAQHRRAGNGAPNPGHFAKKTNSESDGSLHAVEQYVTRHIRSIHKRGHMEALNAVISAEQATIAACVNEVAELANALHPDITHIELSCPDSDPERRFDIADVRPDVYCGLTLRDAVKEVCTPIQPSTSTGPVRIDDYATCTDVFVAPSIEGRLICIDVAAWRQSGRAQYEHDDF